MTTKPPTPARTYAEAVLDQYTAQLASAMRLAPDEPRPAYVHADAVLAQHTARLAAGMSPEEAQRLPPLAPLAPVEVLDALPVEAEAPLTASLELKAELYLDARRRVGQGVLDAARAVAEARATATHGQWGPWLAKVGLSASAAERFVAMHRDGQANALYAEKVREGFLSLSAAGEISQSPDPRALLERLLAYELPPTVADVRAEKRALAPAKSPDVGGFGPADTAPTPDAFSAARVGAAHRGWRLGASTDAPTTYALIPAGVHDPREQEVCADWPALLARLETLPIRASTPTPAPGLEARAAALGARLHVRASDYLLVERGSLHGSTYVGLISLEARIAFLEARAAFEARAARGLTTATAPDAPPDPPDWDAWQARARALGGKIRQSIAGQATLTLGGRNVAWTSAAPGATWAALVQHIVDAEQLGVAAADLSANPAPPEQFAEAQRLARGAGLDLDWHTGQRRFVLTEADGGGSGYPPLAWAQCLGRLDHLLAQQEASATRAAAALLPVARVDEAPLAEAADATARAERAIQDLIDALSPAQQVLLAALMLDDFLDGDDAPQALWERLTEVADANPDVLAWALPDATPAPLALDDGR